MLFIELCVPRGTLTRDQRRSLSNRLVHAVMNAPDAPAAMEDAIARGRALTQAIVQECDAWSRGGQTVRSEDGARYVVRVTLPAGHLSDGMRAELVARITRVIAATEDEPARLEREPRVWVYLDEVPDGNMGGFGRVLRLTDLMQLVLRPGDVPQHAIAAVEGTAPLVIDPVCGMRVALKDSPPTLEHGGVTYAFCCGGCRDIFAAQRGSVSS